MKQFCIMMILRELVSIIRPGAENPAVSTAPSYALGEFSQSCRWKCMILMKQARPRRDRMIP